MENIAKKATSISARTRRIYDVFDRALSMVDSKEGFSSTTGMTTVVQAQCVYDYQEWIDS